MASRYIGVCSACLSGLPASTASLQKVGTDTQQEVFPKWACRKLWGPQKSGAQNLPSLESQRPLPQGRDKGSIFISSLHKGVGNGDSRGPKSSRQARLGGAPSVLAGGNVN